MTLWNLPDYSKLQSFIRKEIGSKRHKLLDIEDLDLSGVPLTRDLKIRKTYLALLGVKPQDRYRLGWIKKTYLA